MAFPWTARIGVSEAAGLDSIDAGKTGASPAPLEVLTGAVAKVLAKAPLELGLDPLRSWIRNGAATWTGRSLRERVVELVRLRTCVERLDTSNARALRAAIEQAGIAAQQEATALRARLSSMGHPDGEAALLTRRDLRARGWTPALERQFAGHAGRASGPPHAASLGGNARRPAAAADFHPTLG